MEVDVFTIGKIEKRDESVETVRRLCGYQKDGRCTVGNGECHPREEARCYVELRPRPWQSTNN